MSNSRPETVFLVAGLMVGVACGPPNDGSGLPGELGTDDENSPTTITETTASTTTPPATTATMGGSEPGSSSSSSADTEEPIFDVGVQDLPPEEGCKKADFLFVIDNSGSMAEHQDQLLDSFPGFIDAIVGSLDDLDSVHVGVVTSDAYEFNEPECQELGALVTRTGGSDSSDAVCTPFVEGNRFFTEEDSLAAAFNCVGRVGTDGSGNEQPITAAIEALQPNLTGVGGCNEGFLRPDAILVLVIVTDDPPFPGTPDDAWPLLDATLWRDQVVAAKGGNEESIVVIGVLPWGDLSCVCPWCCPGYGCMAPHDNAIEFVESFGDRGVLASVCSDDYAPVLADTITTIDATCAVFDPSR